MSTIMLIGLAIVLKHVDWRWRESRHHLAACSTCPADWRSSGVLV